MASKFELSPLGNWIVSLTLLLLVALGLPSLDFFGQTAQYLPIHGGTETLSIVAVLALLPVYLRHRDHAYAGKLAVLAAGFLAVGLIDILHTLSYEDMPLLITPSNPQKAINFWLAGRLAAAITLLAVTFAPSAPLASGRLVLLFAGSLALAAIVFWVGIFHEESLPATFIQGQGLTAIKIGSEVVIALIFVGAAWRCLQQPMEPNGIHWKLMAGAAWVFAMAEIFLCMYSDVTDIFNIAGHTYKVIASVMLFMALRPVMASKLPAGKVSAA